MVVGKGAARGLIGLLGILVALSNTVADAQPVLAAAAPQRDSGGAIVPYTPPTGTYQDAKPFYATKSVNRTPAKAPSIFSSAELSAAGGKTGFVDGVSKEMPLARKANERDYANPDGTFTARIYAGAVNWQAGQGDWRPIDNTVVADARGGYRNASGPFSVHFARSSGSGPLVEVSSGTATIGFDPPNGGSAGAGNAHGSGIDYANVLSNADLQYQVGSDRLKELIVLKKAPASAAPLQFRFPLNLKGLTATMEAGGDVGLFNGKTRVMAIPVGQMSDSKQDPLKGDSATHPIQLQLEQKASGPVVTVIADGSWLTDPARVYPVYIDPTVVNEGGSGDSYVRNDYPSLNQNSIYNSTLKRYEDNAGIYDSTTGTEYTYMTFPLSSLNNQRILSATLNIYFIWSYYVSGYTSYWIRRVNGGWAPNTITWNNQPGRTGDIISDSAVRNVWRSVNMTSWVQNWTSGAWPNYGIEIDENGNGQSYWKKMAADENNDGSRGYIQVNYEGYNASYQFANSDQDPPVAGQGPSYAGPAPNTIGTLPVYVVNNGTDAWPQNGLYRLSYHLLNRSGGIINSDPGIRTYMPIQVNPGQGIWVNASIGAMAAGSYTLQWDMVQEGITWFSWRGVPTANFRVFVAAAPTPGTPVDKTVVVDADRTSLLVGMTSTASTTAATWHRVEVSPSSSFDAGLTVSPNFAPSPGGAVAWTTPPGALKDGARYYLKTVANDGTADSAATVTSFDMDSYQLGQRASWAMDSVSLGNGAAAGVNLATGNLVVGIPGASLPTVSHPLSLGVSYNSYATLVGSYVDDRLPFGATLDSTGCPINWDQGRRFMGKTAVVINNAIGTHQGCFWSASETYSIPSNSSIEVYVYLDTVYPTSEVMLQFHDTAGSWEHRAYWGQNLVTFGADGTTARHSEGPLPAAGQWTRLVLKSSDVGLGLNGTSTIDGLAFTLSNGRAWFDHEGLSESGLGPGFQLGNHLDLGALSVSRLRAYDAAGNPVAPSDLATRVDRVEVKESDGTVWIFRNLVPPALPGLTQPWPQFAAPPGVMSFLTRDADGSWSLSGQDGMGYAFRADGSISTVDLVENQSGQPQSTQPTFTYQFDGTIWPSRLTDIRDPMSRHATFSYGGDRLSTITTWDGRKYMFGYDPLGRLTSVTTPGSRVTSLSYRDLDGVPTQGLMAGFLQTVTNPSQYPTSFTYGDGSSPAKPIDHLVQVTGPAPSSPVTKYAYNTGYTDIAGPRCNTDSTSCPNQYSNRLVFDARHRQVQSIDALGNANITAYDGSDHVLMTVDRAGARMDSTYDSVGQSITSIGPAEVVRFGAGLYGEYYDNADMAGLPKATQTDPTVDFAWSSAAPPPGVPLDVFAARWTGYVQIPQAGSWTFYASSRDGVRLRVGNALAFDNWTTHATADSSGTVTLPVGPARISLEYFSASAGPEVHLSWSGPGVTTRQVVPATVLTGVKFATSRMVYDEGLVGLRGAYYTGLSLSGRANILRTEIGSGVAGVFDLNTSSGAWPGSPLGTTGFSVRWTGRILIPSSGTYLIGAISDDGVRVSVDGNLVVSNWSDHAPTENDSIPLTLARGPHNLAIDYYQNAGGAQFNLRWLKPNDTVTSDVPTSALTPAYGLVTSSIDQAGTVTTHSYNGGGFDPARGLQTDQTTINTDAGGVRVTYQSHTTYNAFGQVVNTTSPKGMTGASPDPNFTRTNAYYPVGDSLGRDGLLQSTTIPGRGTTTYDYERAQTGGTYSAGRPIQMLDQRGTWTYVYDPDGNRTALTPPGRSQPTVTDWDPNGNVTRVSDPQGGTVSHVYDELDRATNTNTYDGLYRVPTPQDVPSVAASTLYDVEGHVLQRSDPAGTVISHYDPRGLVDTMTDPANRQITYGYDAAGRLQTKTLPNGTVVRLGRDAAGRVNLVQNHKTGSPETALQGADYSAIYNTLSKIASVTGPDGTTIYGYDTLGRLETWSEPNGTAHRYYYDLSSNRWQQTVNGVVSHTYTYSGDTTDRLTALDGGSYTYDPNGTGDTIGRPGQTLTWEPFGNVQSVNLTADGSSVSFTRDALGRLSERIQKNGGGATVQDTRYRFNGADDTPAYETDSSGAITRSYVAGPDGLSISYAGNRGGVPTYTYADIHGNVVLTADSTGAVAGGPYTYDPFGVPTNAPAASPYGFVGKWQKLTDPLSGLILMGARPYDPAVGRFLSVDPSPGSAANDYDYASQDPVNRYDLNGRFIELCLAVGVPVAGWGLCGAGALLTIATLAYGLWLTRRIVDSPPIYFPYDASGSGQPGYGGPKIPKKPIIRRFIKGVAITTGAGIAGGALGYATTPSRPQRPAPRPSPSPTYGPPAPTPYQTRHQRNLE